MGLRKESLILDTECCAYGSRFCPWPHEGVLEGGEKGDLKALCH